MSKAQTAALATAFALTAPALWADVTPQEVWDSWQEGGQGRTITAANEETVGDSLIVTGINTVIAGEDGDTSILISEVRFNDTGDGTVAVVFPDSFPVLITPPMDPVTMQQEEVTLTLKMPGHSIIASGTPDALSYQTDFPSIDASATVPNDDGAGTVAIGATLTGATGTYLVQAGEVGTNMTHDYRAKTVDVKISTSGATDGDGSFALSLTDLGGGLELTGLPADGGADFQLALNQGMTMDLNASYGIGSFDLTATDQGTPLKLNGTLGGGDLVASFTASLFRYQTNAKALALNIAATDTTTGDPFTLSATLASTASSAEISGTDWTDTEDFNAALKRGVTVSASAALGPAMVDFVSGQAAPKTSLITSIGSVETRFAMKAAQMDYDLSAKALKFSAAVPDMPVPEGSVDLTELAVTFAMPLTASDKPAPFNLLLKIVDLDVVEALWAQIDPTGQLPHDPATLILNTKGTATLTQDLADESVMDGAPPGLLNSLDLTQLLIRLAGAEVTALGGFTFDNSDTTTFPGMPLPTGKLDIKALGLNALADKLVAMGLVPEDEVMTGRMMLSMFANSNPATDEITSTLEFKDKGFFANGARLQ